ncbi:ABC transporter ATP-binding protein [Roseinatronobacter alkalisoli]|uniref:ABC transporter ATP-binding protein n=1 Tax=Roseinatronobacter alkalisoli TaxID=3028235 RepID=A0ABT5TCK6_9RHOB|nr:ABC transporter ATP-binding protein [Roseinatronobacter sp. HJB301]MDD7972855.1 ABC transporter ATP-binding protein [Roseinatronobacter sp. HJB301]
MTRPILQIEGLRKVFGGLVAVNDVSFSVAEGELLGLIGPNGSGKTTTMNLISGALPATAGTIRLDGSPITGLTAAAISRAGVARTFQLVRILPGMSAVENVIAGGVYSRAGRWGPEAETRARELLARVGMEGRSDLPLSAMTYIDQKRVELARALAADPRLLLLDEWLAGLNPAELQMAISLIRSIHAEGMTIIMVEHVMDAIRSLCGRCVVMNSGVRIGEGATADVLADPQVMAAYLGED